MSNLDARVKALQERLGERASIDLNRDAADLLRELHTAYLMATDAANKGDLARSTAAGMEMEIQELQASAESKDFAINEWVHHDLARNKVLAALTTERDALRELVDQASQWVPWLKGPISDAWHARARELRRKVT
jgi:hypothetical protein